MSIVVQQGAPTATTTATQGTYLDDLVYRKDLTWGTAPVVLCNRQDFTSQPTVTFSVNDTSATQLVLTFNGTPVAAETFKLACHVGGI